MKRSIKYIFISLKMSAISALEYRINFLFSGLYELVWTGIYIVFFEIIYSNTETIADWSKFQTLFLVVFVGLIDSILSSFCNESVGRIPQLIISGEMDYVILKPINKRVILSFAKFSPQQFINIILNIVLLFYFGYRSQVFISLLSLPIFLLQFVCSLIIIYSITYGVMLLSFWIKNLDFFFPLLAQMLNIGNKPRQIYGAVVEKILLYGIPLFIAFSFPVETLLFTIRIENLLISIVYAAMSILVTRFLLTLGLRHYTSASS